MTAPRKPTVFVAYAREDAEAVAAIVQDFEDLHIEVSWDAALNPGKWIPQLKEQLRKTDFFIWVMSPHSVESVEVTKEFTIAHEFGATCYVLDLGGVEPRDALHEVAGLQWTPRSRLNQLAQRVLENKFVLQSDLDLVSEQAKSALAQVESAREQIELRALATDTAALRNEAEGTRRFRRMATAAIACVALVAVIGIVIGATSSSPVLAGPTGPEGPTGAAGPAGPQGLRGEPGATVEQVLAALSTDEALLAALRQRFLQAGVEDFVDRVQEDTSLRSLLQGPQGAEGPPGPKGDQGEPAPRVSAAELFEELRKHPPFAKQLADSPSDGVSPPSDSAKSRTVTPELKVPDDTPAGMLSSILDRHTGIKSLDLSGCSLLNDDDLRPVGKLTQLERLDLGGASGITDAGLTHLRGLEGLEHLVLSTTGLSGTGLDKLSNLRALKSLNLEWMEELRDSSLAGIASLTSLSVLTLTGCKGLTDEGLRVVGSLPNLTDLWISYTGVSDAGLTHLDGLQLATLSMAGNAITGQGLAHIRNDQLRFLFLNDTPQLTDSGLEHLEGLQLVTLWLDGCPNLTEEAIEKLRSNLPVSCTIKSD